MINWKEIPKIDAHIHLLPYDVIKENIDCDDPFIKNGDVEEYINLMKKYNIEHSFIMPFNDPYMMSMDFKIETVHKNLKRMIEKYPLALYCFADIDIRKSIKDTLEELAKVINYKGFIGIKIHPSNTAYPIDGKYYDQIFKFAEENDILIEIHSYPREHLEDDLCSPSRIKNVLNKYPSLRVSIAHLGGFQYKDLIGVNAYFNISAILPDLVNRFDVIETNKILRQLGVEKLVFATDYPDSRCLKSEEIYDKYFEILEQMDFTQKEAEDVCKNNVLKMINKSLN